MLDMTFGAGGHARELLRRSPGLTLICLDRDPVAYHKAQELANTQYVIHVPLILQWRLLPNRVIEIAFVNGIVVYH